MLLQQRVKKVVSDSPGLVDFAVGLENPVLNLSKGQVVFFFGGGGNSKYRRTVISAAHENFLGYFKTLGLVHTSNNLPEWQAVKATFFAPCSGSKFYLLPPDKENTVLFHA